MKATITRVEACPDWVAVEIKGLTAMSPTVTLFIMPAKSEMLVLSEAKGRSAKLSLRGLVEAALQRERG